MARVLSLLLAIALGGCVLDSGPFADVGEGGASNANATTSSTSVTSTSATQATTTSASTTVSASASSAMASEFDAIAWESSDDIGFGIAMKDTQNPLGNNVFVGDAGYEIDLDASKAWVRELYQTRLAALGVRWVYAVQGPEDVLYEDYEIGNSHIAEALQGQVTDATSFIVVAAHSSGAYVAHELLDQLANGLDPSGITAGKVVYFDLDGGQMGLEEASVARLKAAWFVAARDGGTGTESPNKGTMQAAAAAFPANGQFVELDVAGAGCNPGASWCIHMTLVTTRPHDPNQASGHDDYADFVGRPVETRWLDLL